jgi:GNAT superfamily N-acetyltransferase
MSNPKLVLLGRDRRQEAVSVLVPAFLDDPLFEFIMGRKPDAADPCIQDFFAFSCEVRYDLDWPLLGVEQNGRLVGVAGIDEPGHKDWPDSLTQTYFSLSKCIGPQATARLEEYAVKPDQHRPNAPHFYLGVIGVHPAHQGKGLSRILMDDIHARSESHAESTGVALDTTKSANVSYYEHFGYRTTGVDDVGGVTVTTMFRPNAR